MLALIFAFFSSQIGTKAVSFLKTGTGARACGMGETYAGIGEGIITVCWNPGGIGNIKKPEIMFHQHLWLAGTLDECVGVAYPLGKGALGGVLLINLNPGIEQWNENDFFKGTFTTYSVSLNISYGLRNNNLSYGGTFKFLYENLSLHTGFTVAFDIGILYSHSKSWKSGIVVKNIGIPMYDFQGMLPFSIRYGTSYKFEKYPLVTALDFELPIDNNPHFHAGIEYNHHEMFFLRAGFKTGPQDLTTLGIISGITFGIGVSKNGWKIDLACVPYGELGITCRIGIIYTFAESHILAKR